jgi:hypothetical protein
MTESAESAHGKLSPVDQKWTGNRFMALFVVSLGTALVIIYVISALKSGDYSWHPFAHDIVKHTLETSAI